jgi:hypothetical protein
LASPYWIGLDYPDLTGVTVGGTARWKDWEGVTGEQEKRRRVQKNHRS